MVIRYTQNVSPWPVDLSIRNLIVVHTTKTYMYIALCEAYDTKHIIFNKNIKKILIEINVQVIKCGKSTLSYGQSLQLH